MKKLTLLLLWFLSLPIPSFAWGPEGHRVVADIARVHLTKTTLLHIRELLGNDDLAAVSTWADEIRGQRPETYGWHFVDIPWDASGFDDARDCYHPQDERAPNDHQNCVVDRITIFRQILSNKAAPQSQRVEALKFIVHFVGDVHQPLHAVGEARGGNDIHVVVFGSPDCGGRACNLHWVWDEGLIEHTGRPEADYASYLENLIAEGKIQARPIGSPADWANESFRLAHQVWLAQGGAVDETYYQNNVGIVDKRLALAGLRLAALLNQSLGGQQNGIVGRRSRPSRTPQAANR